MEFLEIIRILAAFLLIFFLTGYLIVNKFFKELNNLDKTVLSIGISLCITVLIGVFLGYFGIFNLLNSLIAYIVVIILIFMIKIYFINRKV